MVSFAERFITTKQVMDMQDKPQGRPVKDWLALLDNAMLEIEEKGLLFEDELFVTSELAGEQGEFIKEFLIKSRIVIPVGRVSTLTEKPTGTDAIAKLDRQALKSATLDKYYPKPGEERFPNKDIRLYNRVLYLVDKDRFDDIRHWDLWSQNDGAELVSEIEMLGHVKPRKRLKLKNPTREPDREWTDE